MEQKYIVIKMDHGREIKLCYKKQDDGTWISTIEAETMQDIENYYPSIVEVVDKSHI